MRFSGLPAQLLNGFRAIKVIELPLTTQPHGIQTDTPEQVAARNGEEPVKVMVGIRALTPGERESVLAAAYARAVSKGASGEVEASAAYAHAMSIYVTAAACIDPDSDHTKPLLFFGDTLEQAAETIRSSPLMTDDIVLYLREQQESWQDRIHPQALTVKDSDLYELAEKAAKSADFLEFLRPGMLVQFTHTLAGLLMSSLAESSGSITTSTPDTASSNEKPKKKPQKSK